MTRLLFIDDDPGFVEEMKFLLEESGYDVDTALDGGEAMYKTDHQAYDLVITDMLMGKHNGMEVILHLRTYHPQIKIMAITGGGWASPQLHLDSARMFGSDACLAKPYSIESLLEEIRNLLR
jgi:DNA-binding response OmpR family regulator